MEIIMFASLYELVTTSRNLRKISKKTMQHNSTQYEKLPKHGKFSTVISKREHGFEATNADSAYATEEEAIYDDYGTTALVQTMSNAATVMKKAADVWSKHKDEIHFVNAVAKSLNECSRELDIIAPKDSTTQDIDPIILLPDGFYSKNIELNQLLIKYKGIKTAKTNEENYMLEPLQKDAKELSDSFQTLLDDIDKSRLQNTSIIIRKKRFEILAWTAGVQNNIEIIQQCIRSKEELEDENRSLKNEILSLKTEVGISKMQISALKNQIDDLLVSNSENAVKKQGDKTDSLQDLCNLSLGSIEDFKNQWDSNSLSSNEVLSCVFVLHVVCEQDERTIGLKFLTKVKSNIAVHQKHVKKDKHYYTTFQVIGKQMGIEVFCNLYQSVWVGSKLNDKVSIITIRNLYVTEPYNEDDYMKNIMTCIQKHIDNGEDTLNDMGLTVDYINASSIPGIDMLNSTARQIYSSYKLLKELLFEYFYEICFDVLQKTFKNEIKLA